MGNCLNNKLIDIDRFRFGFTLKNSFESFREKNNVTILNEFIEFTFVE